MLDHASLDSLPGFRRQIRLTPGQGVVSAAVMDNFHEMLVRITHDGAVITGFEAETRRAPFTLCPGAEAVARRSFVGLPLARALVPAEKSNNCTHLYDLAVLAAVHALDDAPLVYDVLVSDAGDDGLVLAEIRRDGVAVWQWALRDQVVVVPEAGPLRSLRHWIATLTPEQAETARMLQWCCLMAAARQAKTVTEASTYHMALSCYAFGGEAADQPRVPTKASVDFSARGEMPVAG